MESDNDPAGRPRPFRFASDEVERYRQRRGPGQPRPLFRRWEAMGLLLLVAVGAAFVPGVRGVPGMGTLLMQTAAAGDTQARLFIMAPPILALLFAWRGSGRMARPFARFTSAAATATLSAMLVFIAFHLGLHLALRATGMWPWWSPWRASAPGATVGWSILIVVTAIRFLWGRAAGRLRQAERDKRRADRGKS
jgi:hypothetical protein